MVTVDETGDKVLLGRGVGPLGTTKCQRHLTIRLEKVSWAILFRIGRFH